jgi:hypothetical protein
MFANDPGNLLATSASADRSKGAKGPDQWLPSFGHCEYVVSAHSSGYLPESRLRELIRGFGFYQSNWR